MAKFEVTYTNQETETVEADRYRDVRAWIVFENTTDDFGLEIEEILRLKASTVQRVERK